VIKRPHFPLAVMLVCIHWYAADSLSQRNREEKMAERGVLVDHATVIAGHEDVKVDLLLSAKQDEAGGRPWPRQNGE